jgi:hypothetical protein
MAKTLRPNLSFSCWIATKGSAPVLSNLLMKANRGMLYLLICLVMGEKFTEERREKRREKREEKRECTCLQCMFDFAHRLLHKPRGLHHLAHEVHVLPQS